MNLYTSNSTSESQLHKFVLQHHAICELLYINKTLQVVINLLLVWTLDLLSMKMNIYKYSSQKDLLIFNSIGQCPITMHSSYQLPNRRPTAKLFNKRFLHKFDFVWLESLMIFNNDIEFLHHASQFYIQLRWWVFAAWNKAMHNMFFIIRIEDVTCNLKQGHLLNLLPLSISNIV